MPLSGLILSTETSDITWFGRHKHQIIGFLIVVLILYKLIDYFFIKSLIPISKDIKLKSGIIDKYQIIRKQKFEMTQDYFFFFAEMEIPNATVSQHTFNQYEVDDYFSIQKTKHSKIVFEFEDRYSINVDHVFED